LNNKGDVKNSFFYAYFGMYNWALADEIPTSTLDGKTYELVTLMENTKEADTAWNKNTLIIPSPINCLWGYVPSGTNGWAECTDSQGRPTNTALGSPTVAKVTNNLSPFNQYIYTDISNNRVKRLYILRSAN
jgi:hypothetical protein